MVCVGGLGGTEFITGSVNYASINGYESTTSSSTTSGSALPLQPVCPNTYGGILMPVGATFTDSYGNTWVAPGGYIDGDVLTSYFFQDPYTVAPLPMLEGWGGMYGTYNGEQGWIITFYCS